MRFGFGAIVGALVALPPAGAYVLYQWSTLCDDARLFQPCYPDSSMTGVAILAAFMVLGLALVGGVLGALVSEVVTESDQSEATPKNVERSSPVSRHQIPTISPAQAERRRQARELTTRRGNSDPTSRFLSSMGRQASGESTPMSREEDEGRQSGETQNRQAQVGNVAEVQTFREWLEKQESDETGSLGDDESVEQGPDDP